MVDIRLVHGDDWKGLYINNKLVLEGHNITIMDLFSILSYSYKKE